LFNEAPAHQAGERNIALAVAEPFSARPETPTRAGNRMCVGALVLDSQAFGLRATLAALEVTAVASDVASLGRGRQLGPDLSDVPIGVRANPETGRWHDEYQAVEELWPHFSARISSMKPSGAFEQPRERDWRRLSCEVSARHEHHFRTPQA
jgi:hypothetical protein